MQNSVIPASYLLILDENPVLTSCFGLLGAKYSCQRFPYRLCIPSRHRTARVFAQIQQRKRFLTPKCYPECSKRPMLTTKMIVKPPNTVFLTTRPHKHIVFNNHQLSSAYVPSSTRGSKNTISPSLILYPVPVL